MYGNWVLKISKKKQYHTIRRICGTKNLKENGNYYICYYIKKPTHIIYKLKYAGIPYSCYRVEYERAANYRQIFFLRTQGPYRCRYCNKKLAKNRIYVDHIIPVAKVQKNIFARILLRIEGCREVNDIRNLAPACSSCNSQKSDKIGLWPLRAWLGKYRFYWFMLWISRVLGVCFIILCILIILYKCK